MFGVAGRGFGGPWGWLGVVEEVTGVPAAGMMRCRFLATVCRIVAACSAASAPACSAAAVQREARLWQ